MFRLCCGRPGGKPGQNIKEAHMQWDPPLQPIAGVYPELAREYRPLLVEMLEDVARWREHKASVFPDDERNARCAAALRAAAEYVDTLPDDHDGLIPFARLHVEIEDNGWASLPPREMLGDKSRVAGRFFFDKRSDQPGQRDFDHLLDEMYTEQLEQWREGIEQSNDQPRGTLVSFFEGEGVPLWAEEDDED
jgi:hypothetical protein